MDLITVHSTVAAVQNQCTWLMHTNQWCTDMEICNPDPIRNFFIDSMSNPYPKI